jgi:hypothetical protein|tara:strand:+ start:1842 stop:2006 length:165 start_codon:yes stop_codon:yes gene_type:complete
MNKGEKARYFSKYKARKRHADAGLYRLKKSDPTYTVKAYEYRLRAWGKKGEEEE